MDHSGWLLTIWQVLKPKVLSIWIYKESLRASWLFSLHHPGLIWSVMASKPREYITDRTQRQITLWGEGFCTPFISSTSLVGGGMTKPYNPLGNRYSSWSHDNHSSTLKGTQGKSCYPEHQYSHVSNCQVDLHPFTVAGRLRSDAIHIQLPCYVQQQNVWFSWAPATATRKGFVNPINEANSPRPSTFSPRDAHGLSVFLGLKLLRRKACSQESVLALVSSTGKAGARERTYMCCWWKCMILLSKQSWLGKYWVCTRCFLTVSSWKSPNSAVQ